MNLIPQHEQATIELMNHLPLASILEVDMIGDVINAGVHLFCRYAGDDGPFNDAVRFHTRHPSSAVWLDYKMHYPLFPELIVEQLNKGTLMESQLSTIWPLFLKDDPVSRPRRRRQAKKR